MKKYERKTKEERRRVLLNKKHELSNYSDNQKLPKNGGAIALVNTVEAVRSVNRRAIALILAIVFVLTSLITGITIVTHAEDREDFDFDTNHTPYQINRKYKANTDYYHTVTTDSGSTTYKFQFDQDLQIGDTVSFNTDNHTLTWSRKPTLKSGYTDVSPYIDGTPTIGDSEIEFDLIQNGTVPTDNYYFYDEAEDTYYYFTMSGADLEYIKGDDPATGTNAQYYRRLTDPIKVNQASVTIPKESGIAQLSGTENNRKVIYVKTTENFKDGHVYLIGRMTGDSTATVLAYSSSEYGDLNSSTDNLNSGESSVTVGDDCIAKPASGWFSSDTNHTGLSPVSKSNQAVLTYSGDLYETITSETPLTNVSGKQYLDGKNGSNNATAGSPYASGTTFSELWAKAATGNYRRYVDGNLTRKDVNGFYLCGMDGNQLFAQNKSLSGLHRNNSSNLYLLNVCTAEETKSKSSVRILAQSHNLVALWNYSGGKIKNSADYTDHINATTTGYYTNTIDYFYLRNNTTSWDLAANTTSSGNTASTDMAVFERVIGYAKSDLPASFSAQSKEAPLVVPVAGEVVDTTENDDLITNKTLTQQENGKYQIELEAYATGEEKTVSEQVPTDYILILDQSGSMVTKDMATDYVESTKTSYSSADFQNDNSPYFVRKVDSSGNEHYYRVYLSKGYMFKKFPGDYGNETLYPEDIIPNGELSYFRIGQSSDDINYYNDISGAYYYKDGDDYYPVRFDLAYKRGYYALYPSYVNSNGDTIRENRPGTSGEGYKNKSDSQPVYHNALNGEKLYPGGLSYWIGDTVTQGVSNIFNGDRYSYTYAKLGTIKTGMYFDFDMYRRYYGYNTLSYTDETGEEHTLDSTEFCDVNNGVAYAVRTDGSSTAIAWQPNQTLYKAAATETRLESLYKAVDAFIDKVAEQHDDNGFVDNRVAIAGFASENANGFLYDNNELLTPDTAVTSGESGASDRSDPIDINDYYGNTFYGGASLTEDGSFLTNSDAVSHNGPQYGSITSSAYTNALVSTKTNTGVASLKKSVSYVTAFGGTQPQIGFDMANGILQAREANNDTTYQKADGSTAKRNTVVIFFTDGQPGNNSYSNQYEVANSVVNKANITKNTYGATVYSVGVFSESDSTPLTYPKHSISSSASDKDDQVAIYSQDRDYVETSTQNSSYYAQMLYRMWINTGEMGDTAFDRIRDYMTAVSSEYPNATNFVDPIWYGTDDTQRTDYATMLESIHRDASSKADGTYYFLASNADDLEAIFTADVLDTETSSTSIQLDEKSILRDIISDGFELTNDTKIKVYTASGHYETENATDITWGERQNFEEATILDPVVDTETDTVTVDVKGFNYTSNYISPRHPGNKLIVTISNLKPTKDGIVYSNTSDSAVYSVNAADVETKEKEFPLPSVNLTSYTVKLDVGSEKTDEVFGVDYQVLEDVDGVPTNVISQKYLDQITVKNDDNTAVAYAPTGSTMQKGDVVTIAHIPVTSKPTVKVNSSSNHDYTFAITSNEIVDIEFDRISNLEEKNNVINITSVPNSKDVVITEETTGTYADTTRAFPINLTLNDSSGDPVSGTYSYMLSDGGTGTVTFTEGSGSIDLSNGQRVTIQALPYNSTLVVTPSDATYYTESVKLGDGEEASSATSTITTDGLTFHVKYVCDELVNTGFSDGTNASKPIIYIFVGMAVISGGAGAAYVYRKKVIQ